MPVQPPPDQPVNVEPAGGRRGERDASCRSRSLVQSAPQLMPVGASTVPVPVPAFATVSAIRMQRERRGDRRASRSIVTVHVPVPLQPPPLQPVNVEPAAGVAVSVTVVPWSNVSLQSAPQLMPGARDRAGAGAVRDA